MVCFLQELVASSWMELAVLVAELEMMVATAATVIVILEEDLWAATAAAKIQVV